MDGARSSSGGRREGALALEARRRGVHLAAGGESGELRRDDGQLLRVALAHGPCGLRLELCTEGSPVLLKLLDARHLRSPGAHAVDEELLTPAASGLDAVLRRYGRAARDVLAGGEHLELCEGEAVVLGSLPEDGDVDADVPRARSVREVEADRSIPMSDARVGSSPGARRAPLTLWRGRDLELDLCRQAKAWSWVAAKHLVAGVDDDLLELAVCAEVDLYPLRGVCRVGHLCVVAHRPRPVRLGDRGLCLGACAQELGGGGAGVSLHLLVEELLGLAEGVLERISLADQGRAQRADLGVGVVLPLCALDPGEH